MSLGHSTTFQKSELLLFKNHKKSKLCHKVIIFITLESSCVTLQTVHLVFLFPILLSSYLDICEKCLKIIFFNSKKIMKSDMGILSVCLGPLWPLYKYP